METSATEAVYFLSLKKPPTSLHSTDTGGRRNPSSEAWSLPADFLCRRDNYKSLQHKAAGPDAPVHPDCTAGTTGISSKVQFSDHLLPPKFYSYEEATRVRRLEASSSLQYSSSRGWSITSARSTCRPHPHYTRDCTCGPATVEGSRQGHHRFTSRSVPQPTTLRSPHPAVSDGLRRHRAKHSCARKSFRPSRGPINATQLSVPILSGG